MTNDKAQMSNKVQMTNDINNKKKYDLEERTAEFRENVIEFVKGIKNNEVNSILLKRK